VRPIRFETRNLRVVLASVDLDDELGDIESDVRNHEVSARDDLPVAYPPVDACLAVEHLQVHLRHGPRIARCSRQAFSPDSGLQPPRDEVAGPGQGLGAHGASPQALAQSRPLPHRCHIEHGQFGPGDDRGTPVRS
jgi:hypothetical protein